MRKNKKFLEIKNQKPRVENYEENFFLEEVKYKLKEVRSFFFKVKQGFKNLWDWKEVIWHDRDWDCYYIYALLLKKLKNMKRSHELYNPFIEESKLKTIGELSEAIKILRRILKDEYFTDKIEEVEQNYTIDWEWYFVPSETDSNLYEMVDTRTKEHKEASMKAYEEAEKEAIRDREKLFNILKEKVDGWWY